MKLWYFSTTEHNGEQEYSHDHLVYADTLEKAKEWAEETCANWYGDQNDGEVHSDGNDYKSYHFFGGEIVLDLNDVYEVTIEQFVTRMFDHCLVGALPTEEGRYQCGSCEVFFDVPVNSKCPHCGSGNYAKNCTDENPQDELLKALKEAAVTLKHKEVLGDKMDTVDNVTKLLRSAWEHAANHEKLTFEETNAVLDAYNILAGKPEPKPKTKNPEQLELLEALKDAVEWLKYMDCEGDRLDRIENAIDKADDIPNILRRLSKTIGNAETVMLPAIKPSEMMITEKSETVDFEPVNLGDLLYFIADMI